MNSREKLAPVKLNRYKDDILFYMFYTNVGDVLQLAAAAELYNRDWRGVNTTSTHVVMSKHYIDSCCNE